MSDESDFATHPYLLQAVQTPPITTEGNAQVRALHPPPGFMLHSWHPTADGNVAVLWVRYKADLGAELGAKLFDMSRPKKVEGT